MTTEGFTSFLMSSDNSGFDERQQRLCDDMSRPLCEYYISSSHNVHTPPSHQSGSALIRFPQTYLVGGQLKGDSTAEGYIRALQQGCRTVERKLDILSDAECTDQLIYTLQSTFGMGQRNLLSTMDAP